MATEAVKNVGFTDIVIKEQIGSGAYGSVFKATCNKLPCAAKKIHEVLVQPQEGTAGPGANEYRAPFRRFETEFQLLQELRHSNIIQYLGMHVDPETKLPILLMELMDTNLTKYFENSSQSLPYHNQVNLCLDITRALLFLHVNKIVHRDLSGGNILLAGNPLRAKVSDFGMAKFLTSHMSRVSHTNAPGTVVYMPPEAFGDEFKESGDIFSFAVLLIQILTQKFPEPQGRIADRIIENEKIKVLIKESERRRNHISLIQEDHPLLPIALDCLKDDETERPLANDLCDRLAVLINTTLYTESKEAEKNPSKSSEFTDFVFITDEKKLTQTEQALQKSEIENKGVKDILEAKMKVLVRLVETNDEMLEIQKRNESTLEQKEVEIRKLSADKTETELKVKNLVDETEKQQKTINEQQKQSNAFQKKIEEQSIQITNQLQTITEHNQQMKEDKEKLSHQLDTITKHDQQIKEDEEKISLQLDTIAKHEEQITVLSLQLEQQSTVLSLQEQKIEELLSQIPAKKKKKQPVDDAKGGAKGDSFFEKFKRTFSSAKDVDTNKLEQTKGEQDVNQSTPSTDGTTQEIDAKTTTTNEPTLPRIESLKKTDPKHKESGLTKSVVETWDMVDENEIEYEHVTLSDVQDEQAREKAATRRLETASTNAVAKLTDIQRIEKRKNETLQQQKAKKNETPQPPIKSSQEKMRTDPQKHKPVSTKPRKTKKKPSSSTSRSKTAEVSKPAPIKEPQQLMKSEAMKSREQKAVQRMIDSSSRSVRTLEATDRVCDATSEELVAQGEQLDRVEKRLDQMNDHLTEGRKNTATAKSPFGWNRKKKDGRGKQLEDSKWEPMAEPQAPQCAITQLRKLPSLGSAVLDENTERMSRILSDLTDKARRQGEMIDQQNGQFDRMQDLTDRNHAALKAVNNDLKKQL